VKHLAILVGIAITSVLVAVANVVIARITGFNVFSLKIWLVVPVGAVMIGAAGASGGLLATRLFHAKPNWFDAVMMIVSAAVTMYLIYHLDYITTVLNDGRKVADFVSFEDFVNFSLTKAHMRIGRGAHDVGEIGQAGYWLALAEFVGFLLGGFSIFAFISSMPRCIVCSSYLRKLKTKRTDELLDDEVAPLVQALQHGDIDAVTESLAWNAPFGRKLNKNDRRWVLTYDLLGCPKCQNEQIAAKVQVCSNGSEWTEMPALETRRNLADGFSLRQAFT
jgi:hypothetical protein